MTLRELLDELRRNVLRDMSTAVGGRDIDQSLWSDDALVMYLQDAETQFVTKTMCLRDSRTAELTSIAMAAGVSDYPLDARVVSCLSATYDGRIQLGRTNYATINGGDKAITPNNSRLSPIETGEPRLFYTDRDTGYISLYPTPTAAEAGKTLRLQVVREPLVPLSKNNLDASPEVPRRWHLDLVEWGAWRALRNHDRDIDGDPANISIIMARANAHKKRFEDAVAECKREIKYMTTQNVEFDVRANWG